MNDLRDKTVWITGASSGIGEALAHAFAQRGAKLVLSARRRDRLEQVATATGARHAAVFPLDISQIDALPARVREVERGFGAVDVMVHNAGVGQRSLVVDTDLSVDRRLMETNYFGPVALTKVLLPSMLARGHGSFVVMSSVLGLFSAPRRSGYAASKHALHGFFDGMRAELSGRGIHVLMVCPGRVRTEFSEAALEGDGSRHGTMDASSYEGIDPALCAERTVRALERSRDEIYVAKWETLPVYLKRLSPALLRKALSRTDMR